jgi:hypothetical protein
MLEAFAFSFSAAASPTLVAALMVMLVSADAKRLMLSFLLGAFLMSVASGLLIVFVLSGSSAVETTRNTLSPAADGALGLIAVVLGIVLATGPHQRVREWQEKRRRRAEERGSRHWRRGLDEGSPQGAFIVGALLGLPGASFLVALDLLDKQDLGVPVTAVCVVVFCLIGLILLEVPLLGFTLARPRRSP